MVKEGEKEVSERRRELNERNNFRKARGLSSPIGP